MAQLVLRIKDDRSPSEQLDELAIDLCEVIAETGASSVERRLDGPAPARARGTELVEVGVVIVQVALDTGLLADLVQRIRDWRGRQRVLHVEIELNGSRLVISEATDGQQQALIDHFIQVTSE